MASGRFAPLADPKPITEAQRASLRELCWAKLPFPQHTLAKLDFMTEAGAARLIEDLRGRPDLVPW